MICCNISAGKSANMMVVRRQERTDEVITRFAASHACLNTSFTFFHSIIIGPGCVELGIIFGDVVVRVRRVDQNMAGRTDIMKDTSSFVSLKEETRWLTEWDRIFFKSQRRNN